MITRETCNLIFNTSLDRKRIVRIPDPVVNLSVPTINFAAGLIITANPFDETIGSLVSLANAEKVVTNRIILF